VSIYIGKCRTRGCKSATRVEERDVQILDSDKWARSATTGEKVLIDQNTGRSYDRSRAYILNGIRVCARCEEHGIYRLNLLRGRTVETIKCDARCMNATGANCDCSCGGANHGANH